MNKSDYKPAGVGDFTAAPKLLQAKLRFKDPYGSNVE